MGLLNTRDQYELHNRKLKKAIGDIKWYRLLSLEDEKFPKSSDAELLDAAAEILDNDVHHLLYRKRLAVKRTLRNEYFSQT